ncbi:DUF3054 domain-containing protein [Paramicrobacterium chengjingii]|uniref:DUF3054 domain-containing protein n=1 Tax=Paramicrobacterium chengjingii TaxID=2769067 RepID=A0ABX6YJ66_9MICO|nr:DUF3054 domain-containing protein [Microbacterium chengjingii]QPZ38823.1 DUF3054 domain-containing protein [Microbacterium chengjingii]
MIIAALALDVVLTLIFALSGRSSHAEALDPAGIAGTWWPFLVALVVGWIVTLAWRRPTSVVRTGIPLWIITVAGGMLLRAASGQGTALPFIIVATIVLGLALVGWRLIALLVRTVRARNARESKE